MGVKLKIEATLNKPLCLALLDAPTLLLRVAFKGAKGSKQRAVLVQSFQHHPSASRPRPDQI